MTILGLLVVVAAHAQQSERRSLGRAEDLASQNLSRVAASAPEIKAVLAKVSGLLIELKRWVARDATNHGQVLSESDLTDYAIFDRLDSDVQFRSVATALLQQYGYLLPKLNPESDQAKEQELLRVERTKWLAQAQEEERGQARAKAAQELEKARTANCDPQRDPGCNAPAGLLPAEAPGQERQMEIPQLGNPQNDQNLRILPNGDGSVLQRAQLRQTGAEFPDSFSQFSQLPLPGSFGSSSSSSNVSMNGSSSLSSLMGDTGSGSNRQLAAAYSGASPGITGSTDGLLAAYGMGMGTGMGAGMDGVSGMLPNMGQTSTSMALANSSPLVPMQPTPRYTQRTPIQPPEMVRKPSPYEDVPSLYDMYVQAVARPSSPRRFGSEIFENGTRDLRLIPMDLPVGPDYVIGPGDGLSIDLWGGVSQRLTRTVDREGRVSLPEVGPVLVSGKSLADVQQNLQQILRTQFRDVSAGVSLARLRTIRVYEVGDITSPGAYDISSLSTPLNALFVAGGPTSRGSLRILRHYRGSKLVQTVDVYDLLLHGVKTDIQRLENGDTIQVPPMGPQVTIEGMVRRPAMYELRDEKNLASVLELAGGLLPAAALRHIEVQRLVEHEKQTMLSVDIPDAEDKSEVTKKLESFEIRDGDRVRIYPIAPYNQDAIYLEGHVVRPGRYSYHPDMRVSDVISSYKDLLPEPSPEYAELIHLNAPDFKPSVESFDLAGALADPSHAPVLHAMDTLRVFSRFDFQEPPRVSVMGDVRAPGTYPTAGQIHLADAIHLAGGLAPDAETADAQIFRYLPDGQFKIFSVGLSQALAGDPLENIVLDSRDRLLVHRNPNAVEPATVYIEGDVAKPGRYPLTTNMHVADLIRIGGGLKPSADPQSADLTKYEWSNGVKLSGEHKEIAISAALAGDSNSNPTLGNGDVVTIRQLPGWNDLGASIVLKGEVRHPGTYGIRPGERLSSVLERAGGFQPGAYPYGGVLQRLQVRELETREQDTMILRIKAVESNLEQMPENDPRQRQAKEAALQQYRTTLEQLSANPPLGRVNIRISSDLNRWKNTPADIEVRGGDSLTIPKKPSYIMVSGQVYNATAVSYRSGKSAKWYLSQAGGPTLLGDRKSVFVIRDDGSVLGAKASLWGGESLNAVLQPGDTVVVPERAIGGTIQWQTIFSAAQLASSVATAAVIALHY